MKRHCEGGTTEAIQPTTGMKKAASNIPETASIALSQ
jgi:hypothetical protein